MLVLIFKLFGNCFPWLPLGVMVLLHWDSLTVLFWVPARQGWLQGRAGASSQEENCKLFWSSQDPRSSQGSKCVSGESGGVWGSGCIAHRG